MTTPSPSDVRRALVCLAAPALGLVACRAEQADRQTASAPSSRAVIVQPAAGDTVGPDVTVMLGAEGVQVMAADGQRVEGQGHHHLFIDVDLTPMDSVIPAGVAGIVHIGTGASESTVTGLRPGSHRIIAVLAYGNHLPMQGVATDTVTVVVR
ncbi:MAG TPA: DUF4399 domain-containing protein [Gemmatimonadales bacterium]|nr:DUF4399 domain-containing protein [Gemmatimonadales bacterium]